MTTAPARKGSRAAAAVLAQWAGTATRRIGMGVPGIAGPALVVVGIGAFDWRVGTIVAGVILWALDRKV